MNAQDYFVKRLVFLVAKRSEVFVKIGFEAGNGFENGHAREKFRRQFERTVCKDRKSQSCDEEVARARYRDDE